ncbi:MAG: AAA family ATPase [Candidatus Dojkabacteria bacterium]|jgi:broad-specificity NMP kinase|nr:AAA family ATPase [Candidatus Dojkabacteria bacterium]
MRYFITGTPGSGKTTIGKLLQEKGYAFVDSDHAPGLANWYNDAIGEVVPSNTKEDAEWYRHHSWNWDREELKKLLDAYKEKDVFLCGITSNQTNDLDLFDKVFLLTANQDELRTRMLNRRTTANAETIEGVFEWHDVFEKEMIKHGAEPIDSTQDPGDIVNEILSSLS